jgi:hypothetical protein
VVLRVYTCYYYYYVPIHVSHILYSLRPIKNAIIGLGTDTNAASEITKIPLAALIHQVSVSFAAHHLSTTNKLLYRKECSRSLNEWPTRCHVHAWRLQAFESRLVYVPWHLNLLLTLYKSAIFSGQILNRWIAFFSGRREYVTRLHILSNSSTTASLTTHG